MAEPQFVAQSNTGAAVASSRVVTKPTGSLEDHNTEVVLYLEDDRALTVPTGWTQKEKLTVGVSPDFHFTAYKFWKRLGASEPATWTWSWTGATFCEAQAQTASGVKAGDPYDGHTAAGEPLSVNTSPALSLTVASLDTLLTWFHCDYIGGAKAPPTGFTERFDGGVTSTQMCATKGQAAAGSTGSLTSTYVGAPGPVAAFLAALLPAVLTPVADFSASSVEIPQGELITFTDLSTNTPTSWAWDFGDGDTSTDQNPTHQFNIAGTFTVSLTATNSSGSDEEEKIAYITVTPLGFDEDDDLCSTDDPKRRR